MPIDMVDDGGSVQEPAALREPYVDDDPTPATPEVVNPSPDPKPSVVETDPKPDPTPTSTDPDFDYDWLETFDREPDMPPPGYGMPPPGYGMPPPGYGPPPRTEDMTEQQFRDFLARGPDAYFDDRLNRAIGPVAAEARAARNQAAAWMNAQADVSIDRAKRDVEAGIRSHLIKDEAYRGNKRVKQHVDRAIKNMLVEASHAARSGDPRRLAWFSEPQYWKMVVANAKIAAEYGGPASTAYTPPGAVVEAARPEANPTSVELPPDLEAIAQRRGPAYRAKLIAAMQETEKRGDFYFED